jgi:ferredoxin-NADP reductase
MLGQPLEIAGWVTLIAVCSAIGFYLLDGARRRKLLTEQGVFESEVLKAKLGAARAEWDKAREREVGWKGFANFVVARKVEHGDSGICSFYLKPKDPRLKLADFKPGQHLVFELHLPGKQQPLTRRYSLSDRPGLDYYRVSVKRCLPPRNAPDAPPGVGSCYFHDHVEDEEGALGNLLLVGCPDGSFSLDPIASDPVVLIGGGIGLTPMLSMFNAIAEENPTRETWLFYGVRDSEEDVIFDEGMFLAGVSDLLAAYPNLHLHISYSRPLARDAALLDSQPGRYNKGRVGVDLFKSLLPSNNYRFYICGPEAMMDQVEDDLIAWGVPEEDVMSERFGPPKTKPATGVAPATITFSRSAKSGIFTAEAGNLLEFAEGAGVPIPSDCRSGACGQCKVAIVSGKVSYPRRVNYKCPPGSCLTCSCIPEGDLELDC